MVEQWIIDRIEISGSYFKNLRKNDLGTTLAYCAVSPGDKINLWLDAGDRLLGIAKVVAVIDVWNCSASPEVLRRVLRSIGMCANGQLKKFFDGTGKAKIIKFVIIERIKAREKKEKRRLPRCPKRNHTRSWYLKASGNFIVLFCPDCNKEIFVPYEDRGGYLWDTDAFLKKELPPPKV